MTPSLRWLPNRGPARRARPTPTLAAARKPRRPPTFGAAYSPSLSLPVSPLRAVRSPSPAAASPRRASCCLHPGPFGMGWCVWGGGSRIVHGTSTARVAQRHQQHATKSRCGSSPRTLQAHGAPLCGRGRRSAEQCLSLVGGGETIPLSAEQCLSLVGGGATIPLSAEQYLSPPHAYVCSVLSTQRSGSRAACLFPPHAYAPSAAHREAVGGGACLPHASAPGARRDRLGGGREPVHRQGGACL